MMYFTADESVSLVLPFLADTPGGRDYMPAAFGSVTYTLRDHAGAPLVGYTDVPAVIEEGATEAVVTIPAAANGKDVLRSLERRTITYRWASETRPFSGRLSYYLTGWLNLDCTPADVRSALGLSAAELADVEINLIGAYFLLKEEGVDVDTALATGDYSTVKINKAIALREALRLIPSLRLRAARVASSGSEGFTRFDVDWDALRDDLKGELADLLPEVERLPVGSAIFALAGRPDPFGGV